MRNKMLEKEGEGDAMLQAEVLWMVRPIIDGSSRSLNACSNIVK